ncbi:MAG TPA: 2-dehydropantoate 2-reductase [Terracidiphilus sp.]
MKHAILGAGAVGGLIGAALASLREHVTVIVRPENLPEYPKSLTLERPSGTITTLAKPAAALTEPVDVLWIATKTYQLQTALEAVQSSPALVVPLLNGVDHVGMLRARFGGDRVVPATIAVEAERVAPGRFVQRSPFVRLSIAASGEQRLAAIVARLGEIGFSCQFVLNEQTLLWSKLCFLAPFALVTSASGKNKGEVFGDASWKHKLDFAIAEACAVANASGAQVDGAKLQAAFESMTAGMRSSMQKDVAAKRELELDAIGRAILRGGKRYGIDVSTTAELIDTIQSESVAR